MANERSKQDEWVSNLKSDYKTKLESANEEIKSLTDKVSKLERCLEKSLKQPPPEVKVDTPTPPMVGSPATRKRKVKHKDSSTSSKRDKNPADSSTTEVRPESRPRSASSVTSNEKLVDVPLSTCIKLSPEVQHTTKTNTTSVYQRRPSTDKMTITDLVAESLKYPGSMAAIRKELKSDGLTPKIQRKFHTAKNTPMTLPAMPQNATSNGVAATSVGRTSTPFGIEKNRGLLKADAGSSKDSN